MSDMINNHIIKQWCIIIFGLFCLAMTCCNQKNTITNTGDLDLRLEWQTPNRSFFLQRQIPDPDVCTDFQITGIEIRVKNTSNKIVAESKRLACSDHSARLDGIAPQSGYIVEVDGFVDEQVQWHGQKKDVKVVANQSTEPVIVAMNFVGETGQPPGATIVPAHGTANVPTNSTVTISFDQAMAVSTINDQSIRVSQNNVSVRGTVTYDPNTYEAVFQPDEELAITTTYTVRLTKDVMTTDGQTMVEEISTQFTTTMVWFVDGEVPASGNGKSWNEAFQTIPQVVDAADNGDQIWVKHGTYQPKKQIVINKAVELLGGFKGTETLHHQRDWKTFKTVVNGNNKHRCFFASSNAVIDGFTITGGYADGGGMYIDEVAPQISNCNFIENSSAHSGRRVGGAIYINSGDPVIKDCLFESNKAAGWGGAIHNHRGKLNITDCVFKNNSAPVDEEFVTGGAISNIDVESSAIINCLFDANTVSGEFGSGGAIFNANSNNILISACRFTNNRISAYVAQGGAITNYDSKVTVQNSVFYNNHLISIGSIPSNNSDSIEEVIYGGTIYNSASSLSTVNCTFSSNSAEIIEEPGANERLGGAIANNSKSNVIITNSLFWDNKVKAGPQVEFNYDDQILDGENSNTKISSSYMENKHTTSSPPFGVDFHLNADSPCIGGADSSAAPASDIDGDPRPQEGPTDIGADQFADNDNDQLPDYWEALYAVDYADSDEDGDGQSNLEEYRAGTDPTTVQQIISATSGGSVSTNGHHEASDSNIIFEAPFSGDNGNNAFLTFDVHDISNVESAALRLELVETGQYFLWTELHIWSVDTPMDTLVADFSGKPGVDIFKDLGSGIRYGRKMVTRAEAGTVLDIQLNPSALKAIQAASSNSKKFIIGLSSAGIYDSEKPISFGNVGPNMIHQLVLNRE